jgi:hypothetical protein
MSNGTVIRLGVLLAALTGLAISSLAVTAIAQALSSGPHAMMVNAERPRYKCSKLYTRRISAVWLSASRVRPNCGGAALMAEDIHYDAARRFPRPLRTGYVAYAHGTNTAGDPRARYRCSISNKLIIREGHPVRRTRALCTNVKGDSFLYVFDMA